VPSGDGSQTVQGRFGVALVKIGKTKLAPMPTMKA